MHLSVVNFCSFSASVSSSWLALAGIVSVSCCHLGRQYPALKWLINCRQNSTLRVLLRCVCSGMHIGSGSIGEGPNAWWISHKLARVSLLPLRLKSHRELFTCSSLLPTASTPAQTHFCGLCLCYLFYRVQATTRRHAHTVDWRLRVTCYD